MSERRKYEQRLYAELQELDDPLKLFLEYTRWLRDHGGNDAEVRRLLERCIRYIWRLDTYLDDPRFVQTCLEYVNGSNSHDARAICAAMFNRGVGGRLAMYYEKCAEVMLEDGCAPRVIRTGITRSARPLQRLRRRLDALPPSHDTSMDMSFMYGFEMPQFLQDDDHEAASTAYSPVYKVIEIPGRKPERIECNFDLLYTPQQEYSIEHVLAKRMGYYGPFDVEVPGKAMMSEREQSASSSGNAHPSTKLEVFRDSDPLPEGAPPQLNGKAQLREKVQVHNDDGKWDWDKDVVPGEESQAPGKKLNVFRDTSPPPKRNTHPTTLTDHTPKRQNTAPLHQNITTTTLPLNDEPGPSMAPPHSPTVTMFSKDAMSDVYSMFNQNNNNTETFSEQSDNTTNRFAQFEGEGFTQEMTRQNIDDLTEVKPAGQLSTQPPDTADATVEYKSTLPEFMTPIQENTEETHPRLTPEMKSTQLPPSQEIKSTQSSPFLTQPQRLPLEAHVPEYSHAPVIEHPLDTALRQEWLSKIQPPLDEYKSFYRYNQPLRMSALLKKIHKASKSENKNPIVDFKKTGDLYCIRSELGQGGYAIVYLAESSTGNLKALKIERPASMWEYYILRQIEMRLSGMPVLRSIIQVDSLHYFLDESYLVLNYANQGTVLDLINMLGNKPVDELLCMFLTIEMMKAVESIHKIGIIHGDLKPDNCMIRFEPLNSVGEYNSEGNYGWDSKGIFLIDFGRSFDMTLLPKGTQFKSDWKTDQQDCSQMRLGQEWTYEADYYGLAGIIHSLLFGKFIDTVRMPNNMYKLRSSFKRYWHSDIWDRVFDVLLNSGDNNHGPLPLTLELQDIRHLLEDVLAQDHNSDALRRIIRDLEEELAAPNKDNI